MEVNETRPFSASWLLKLEYTCVKDLYFLVSLLLCPQHESLSNWKSVVIYRKSEHLLKRSMRYCEVCFSH